MKKTLIFMCVGLVLCSWLQVSGDTLEKTSDHLYIATFNVYTLGTIDPKYHDVDDWDFEITNDIPERITNLSKIIAVGGFHLVAIQEVRSGPKGFFAIKDLQRALIEFHDLEYHFIISDYIGKGFIPEAMAFLFRPCKIDYKPIGEELSINIKIPGRDLVKTQWVAEDFDFTLISAHLAWGNESDRNAGYEKIKDIFDNPSYYSDDPDIIVLGDFNRFGKGYESVIKLKYDNTKFLAPNITFFDPDFNNLTDVTSESISGQGIPNDNPQYISTTVANNTKVYDMIIFSSDVIEEFPPGKNRAEYEKDFGVIHFDEPDGFGYQQGTDNLSHHNLKNAYSDHRPLWIRFKTKGNFYDGTWDD